MKSIGSHSASKYYGAIVPIAFIVTEIGFMEVTSFDIDRNHVAIMRCSVSGGSVWWAGVWVVSHFR